jgi:kinetochore protein Mis13/DSN1
LQKETAEWDEVTKSASVNASYIDFDATDVALSPLKSDLLDTPQRAIYDQLHTQPSTETIEPALIQQRLREISNDLEFAVDQFAHGVHALQVTKDTAERLADHSLADAATALEERHKERTVGGKSVDPMDALRGLAKVLNSKYK